MPLASAVMIIRHAEKPSEPPAAPPPFGVTPDGMQDDHSLSVRGWQRAGALATFFAPFGSTPPSMSRPQFIYAVKVNGDDDNPHYASGAKIGTKGKRAQQTVAPLAEKLGSSATLNFAFDKGDEAAMIHVRYGVSRYRLDLLGTRKYFPHRQPHSDKSLHASPGNMAK